ncbi:MAG: NAD+ synthase (glutamine-hydrolyzing) [Lysobacterales bacterium]
MKIALAQFDFLVGDLSGNLLRALECIEAAKAESAALIVFPELALSGYPPEDLLLRPGFMRRCAEVLGLLIDSVHDIDVVIGHPWEDEGQRYNAASWIRNQTVIGRYYKQCLPNYAVFDERRYFAAGNEPLIVELEGVRFGVLICEDTWESEPALQAKAAGAECLIAPNASPYRDDKLAARAGMFSQHYAETSLPMVYCNLIGGQDELVFDGRSTVLSSDGLCSRPGPHCIEKLLLVDYDSSNGMFSVLDWSAEEAEETSNRNSQTEEIYTVLVRGLADYVHKNGFSEVVLGLSGGIDSALTLVIAVDALGAENVHAVMMPSQHTSDLSHELAESQAKLLNVDYRCIPIDKAVNAMSAALEESFRNESPDVTEENLQARIRGTYLMALSNKFGWLVLATSNKSELAVGYSTIYGDMCGGFSPIKDCLKTRVYDLSHYRNSLGHAIPAAVIDRPPTAELAPDQTDQDSLPEYEILDGILQAYIDQDRSIYEIVAAGYEELTVRKVAAMVLRNEYKRRQGAPGTRVTSKGFGRDRRYPITSGWRESRD